jgi:O-acetylserine/cysteine efflux transporter
LAWVVGICFATALFSQQAAAAHSTTGLCLILIQTAPIILVILGTAFLGERLTGSVIAAALVCLLGMILVDTPSGGGVIVDVPWWAVALMILSAVSLALTWALSGLAYRKGARPLAFNAAFMAISGILALPVQVLFGGPLAMTPEGWVTAAYLALIGSVVAVTLYLTALRRIGASRTALLGMTEVIFGLVFANYVMHEDISAMDIIGTALIMTGIAIILLRPRWLERHEFRMRSDE